MSLIFSFKSLVDAIRFANRVQHELEREALVFTTEEEADANDIFPFQYELPVVHVARCRFWEKEINFEEEETVIELAQHYSGKFVGT